MSDESTNRCLNCRWRIEHEDKVSGIKIPCCHGGPPVNIWGDFPRCPELPYDTCGMFEEAPAAEYHAPFENGPTPENKMALIQAEQEVDGALHQLCLPAKEGIIRTVHDIVPPDQLDKPVGHDVKALLDAFWKRASARRAMEPQSDADSK